MIGGISSLPSRPECLSRREGLLESRRKNKEDFVARIKGQGGQDSGSLWEAASRCISYGGGKEPVLQLAST